MLCLPVLRGAEPQSSEPIIPLLLCKMRADSTTLCLVKHWIDFLKRNNYEVGVVPSGSHACVPHWSAWTQWLAAGSDSNFLPAHPLEAAVMANLIGSLPPTWEIGTEFLSLASVPGPSPGISDIWGINQGMKVFPQPQFNLPHSHLLSLPLCEINAFKKISKCTFGEEMWILQL